jgi:peroxiredoxin
MPAFERLHHDFAGRGLAVVAVNTREAAPEVRRYAKELSLTLPLVLDRGGDINRAYGVIGLPTTFVIARDGRAVGLAIGPRDWSGPTAKTLIGALLAE